MSVPSSGINRRVALQLMASAGISISSMSLSSLARATETINKNANTNTNNYTNNNKLSNKNKSKTSPPASLTGNTRFNLDEAHRVMSQLDLDALVLGDGPNFQQATGFIPVISKMGWPTINIALLVRDPQPKVITVMLAFSYYYMAADTHPLLDSKVFLYAGENSSQLTQDAALDSIRFPDRGESKLRDIEKHRVNATKQTLTKNALHNSMGDALTAALKSI